jgi:3'-phosphoadenosine 5'-phosphosulfate sulfotransferase (PAPS reductase)/FAD synthetase
MTYDLFGATLDDLERASLTLLDRAISYYRPAKVWALFSGGTDSTASALLASKHPAFSGVLHLDTETGIPQTRHHVEAVAEAQGWELTVEPPRTTSYEELVMAMGFPGRPHHGAAYNALKDRALSRLCAKKRNGGRPVLLVSGARSGESRRRMGTAKLIMESKNRIWLNAILHWPKQAAKDYAARHGIPESPVSKVLGMSGECCCGAYAAPGERERIRTHFPAHDEWISWLERKVEAAGKWPHWGVQAPGRLYEWQFMPALLEEPMCNDCKLRAV